MSTSCTVRQFQIIFHGTSDQYNYVHVNIYVNYRETEFNVKKHY